MTLKEAKKELKEAWITGEGYDVDQMFTVAYKDGTVLSTDETNDRLPLRGIIGIEFHGSDAAYAVGKELFNGELVDLVI